MDQADDKIRTLIINYNRSMNYKNQSITVVGTVRNCEDSIVNEYEILKHVFSDFKQVNFFIVESDSTDKSVDKLDSLKTKDSQFDYISLGNLRTELTKRTERIAFCRNKYLEEIQSNQKYNSTDYVVISDLDGMNSLLSKESISSCWTFDTWDVCTANQTGKYYDIWALRHPIWSPNDCWEQYVLYNEKLNMPSPIAQRKTIGSRQVHIPTNTEPIEVDSAFGGLGIYKKKALENIQYVGITKEGNEVCEHLSLHAKIRENGFKIFINPRLVNCQAPKEHILSSKKEDLKYVAARLFPNFFNYLQRTIKPK